MPNSASCDSLCVCVCVCVCDLSHLGLLFAWSLKDFSLLDVVDAEATGINRMSASSSGISLCERE